MNLNRSVKKEKPVKGSSKERKSKHSQSSESDASERKKNPKVDEPQTAAGKAKSKKEKVYATLSAALANSTMPVKPDGILEKILPTLGINVFPVPGRRENEDTHLVTHACRDESFKIIAANVAATTQSNKVDVLDIYGRDQLVPLPKTAEGIYARFSGLRPDVFSSDFARNDVAQQVSSVPDAVSFVDIYQSGDWKTPLAPELVAQYALLSTLKTAYIVQHVLREPYGVDSYRYTNEDGMPVWVAEGSWITTVYEGQELISFTPDRSSTPYPVHPIPSWLVTGSMETSHGWLHVHMLKKVGPFAVYKCVLAPVRGNPVGPVALNPCRYRKMEPNPVRSRIWTLLYQQGFLVIPNLLLGRGPQAREITASPTSGDSIMYLGFAGYDSVVSNSVSQSTAGRVVGSRLIQTVVADVKHAISMSPLGLVLDRTPGLAYALQMNTVIMVLTQRADAGMVFQVNEDLLMEEANGMTALRQAVISGSPLRPALRWWIKALGYSSLGLALAVCWYFFRRRRQGPTTVGNRLAYIMAWLMHEAAPATHAMPETSWVAQFLPVKVVHGSIRAAVVATMPEALEPVKALMSSWTGVAMMATEEVCKWLLGPLGSVGLAVCEALPVVASGVPLVEVLKIRGLPSAFHLLTAVAYRTFGFQAVLATIPIHVLMNNAILWNLTNRAVGYQNYLAMFPWKRYGDPEQPRKATLSDLKMCHSRLASYDGPGEVLEPGAFKIPSTRPLLKPQDWYALDWRFKDLTVKVNGKPLKIAQMGPERAQSLVDELSYPPCSCEDYPKPFHMCRSCHASPEVRFMWPLLVTNGLCYRPENTMGSLVVGLVNRAYANPYGFHSSLEHEAAFAQHMRQRLKPAISLVKLWLVDEGCPDRLTIEECASLMPKAKGTLLLSFDRIVKRGGLSTKVTIQPKHNETIKSMEAANWEIGVSPRLVFNVHGTVQSRMLPVARAVARFLKHTFRPDNVFRIGVFLTRIVISETSSDNLLIYADMLMRDPAVCIVVSCDDNVMSTGSYKDFFGYAGLESDYSHYDQSQFRPFFEADEEVLGPIIASLEECPGEFWDLQHAINAEPGIAKSSRPSAKGGPPDHVEILAQLRYFMRTGAATTSDFGSLHNIYSLVTWLLEMSELRKPTSYTECARKLGLATKEIIHTDSMVGSTFLKGVFLMDPRNNGTATWNTLPSACLKLGKMMRDPCSLLGEPRADIASEAMFKAIMASVNVPDDYPILGAYKQLAHRLAGAHPDIQAIANRKSKDPNFVEGALYKTIYATAPRDVVLSWMEDRYHITPGDVCRVEKLIHSIQNLPAVIMDEVFEILRDVDYV